MQRYLAILLCAVMLLGLPARAAASSLYQPQADHLTVLFILDDSGSMKVNDPTGQRYAAAALFVAALDIGDRVGALRFSTGSQPITQGVVEILDEQDKAVLIDMLEPVPADGYTDMKAAFESAMRMLDSTDLQGHRTVVLFLTDGKPEVPEMPAAYQNDTLAAAQSLGLPIYAISLTQEGQTAFLSLIAAETGGQLISADSAEDLLDSYLFILGELKDRTILGKGNEAIRIDEGLAPYIGKATFIAVHAPSAAANWISPDGLSIGAGLPGAAVIDEERFSAVTVINPSPGDWQFEHAGGGEVQVRAVLHARLRAKVTTPAGFVPAGQPLTITAELIEEQAEGSQTKILGDASFSARITLPDGLQESLDVLYDDGTHGDITSGDGTFSRLFPNVSQPGVYQVELLGKKGQVPVRASGRFEAVEIPPLVIDEPGQSHYQLRGEPVPLAIHLAFGHPDQLEGTFAAHVTTPSNEELVVQLDRQGMSFSGSFTPTEDGEYAVRYIPVQAAYLGILYSHSTSTSFEVQMIPAVIIRSMRPALGRDRYELAEAQAGGIAVEVLFASTSRREEALQILPVDLAGFTIREHPPYSIPPGESKLVLHLAAEPGILPGDRQLSLRFLPSVGLDNGQTVDVIDQTEPIEFSIFSPSLKIDAEVITSSEGSFCWQSPPVLVKLRMNSTSKVPEQIHLRLDGVNGARLSRNTLDVPPGISDVILEIRPEETFLPGEYSGQIVVVDARDGVQVLPGSLMPVSFTVVSPLQACRTPLIFSGFGLLVLAMIGIKVGRVVRNKNRSPLVKGTLQHWRKDAPAQRITIDLTALNREEVTIGSGSQCDVIVPDAGLEAEHARISAEKDADGRVRWMLTPLGMVTAGYRAQNSVFELQEQVAYQMGEQTFTFLRDADL